MTRKLKERNKFSHTYFLSSIWFHFLRSPSVASYAMRNVRVVRVEDFELNSSLRGFLQKIKNPQRVRGCGEREESEE